MDGCRPKPRGGPSWFIQEEEDDAAESPGLKHAPPVRWNRCVDLPCLSRSYFSCPSDSIAHRARSHPGESNRQAANAKPLTLSVRPPNALSGFPEKNRWRAERPLHRINRSNFLDDFFLTDTSHPDKPHNSPAYLIYQYIRRIMKFALPRAGYSPAAAFPYFENSIIQCHIECRMIPDATASRNLRRTAPLEEPIPAAPELVCGHSSKQTFSRADKPFSRADDIYIHTCRREIRFLRERHSEFQTNKTLISQASNRHF